MQLLSEEKLIWSPVVANSAMNRERVSSGINSYEKDLKLKPESFLELKIKQNGQASWLDLCCGKGKALIQTANYFYKKAPDTKIILKGIDLVDEFETFNNKITFLSFESKSIVSQNPNQKYDLITCCHGIHYLGDKLKVIETSIHSLNKDGTFIANMDLNDIFILNNNDRTFLTNLFKDAGIVYSNRTKIIKRVGFANNSFKMKYLGADDTTGPNYSGQPSVRSHYAEK